MPDVDKMYNNYTDFRETQEIKGLIETLIENKQYVGKSAENKIELFQCLLP